MVALEHQRINGIRIPLQQILGAQSLRDKQPPIIHQLVLACQELIIIMPLL